MSNVFIGIDLGGTNIKFGCFDEQMKLLAKHSVVTESQMAPEVIVEAMAKGCHEAAEKAGVAFKDVKYVGIGTPGPVDLKRGVIVAAPNLPKFKNTPLRDMVAEKMGVPAVMENDANAAAWGEFVQGAAKDVRDMIFFTLGTGIGGGVVANGSLVHGDTDAAAELGHVIIYPDGDRVCGCGQRGCAEVYASASNTADRAVQGLKGGVDSTLKAVMDQKGEVTSKDVFDHAKKGDKFAESIVDGTAKTLALLCINMLHTTDPSKLVFAGGMIAAGDYLLDKIKAHFNKYIWTMKSESVEICFATLGEDAGIIGTGSLAKIAFEQG